MAINYLDALGHDVEQERKTADYVRQNIAAPGIASTVHVTPVNDEPTLTATAVNPTFTEGGPQVDLFDSVAVSTIEAGQRLTAMTWTVTNVASGANEFIIFDDFEIALTDGNSVVTDIDNMTITVSLVGTTATLSFSDVSVSASQLRNLIDDMSYRNTSQDPGTADRVITITELVDSGSNGGQDDNTAALSVATTVHITAINDEPTLAATALDPTFTEGGAAADIFSGVTASTIEAGQTFTSMTLTVSNVTDGANEILNYRRLAHRADQRQFAVTATNGLTVTVTRRGRRRDADLLGRNARTRRSCRRWSTASPTATPARIRPAATAS